MINYSLDGQASVNFHYKTRLMSSTINKLFMNIFQPGVIAETGTLISVDAEGNESEQGIRVKIPTGYSFFISPNNRNAGGVIQKNFEALSALEQAVIEKQILKCDVIKDFYVLPRVLYGTTAATTDLITAEGHGFVTGDKIFIQNGDNTGLTFGTVYYVLNPGIRNFQISETNPLLEVALPIDLTDNIDITIIQVYGGYLVAEFNYLEFSQLEVDFKIIPYSSIKPTDNKVVLGYASPSGGYILKIDTTDTDLCELNNDILYAMNVDRIAGYHAGNEAGQIPVSNGSMCSGLNVEMISGHSGYEAGEKWAQNAELNAEQIADAYGVFYQPGNDRGNVPLSNQLMNIGLNAELLGGSGYQILTDVDHIHSIDYLNDGPIFRKIQGVNTSHYLTHDSFETGAFTKEKIHDECFFAKNDDLGGRITIVSGEVTLTANYSTVTFTPKQPDSGIFEYPPNIMLQIVDTAGTYATGYHVKVMAYNITRTTFQVKYTIYFAGDGDQYLEQPIINGSDLTIHFVAWGYGVDNTDNRGLTRHNA